MVQSSQNTESIFDFIYLDNKRIKFFYAQLCGQGSILNTKQSHHISQTEGKSATIGVPTITGGNLNHSKMFQDNLEKNFDASHTMPTEIIHKLDELGFIKRELIDTNIGKIVLLSGALSIVDISIVKQVLKPLHDFQLSNMTAKERNSLEVKNLKSQIDNIDKLLQIMPFAVEGRFVDNETKKPVWMSLQQDELFDDVADIHFKHGVMMPTTDWYLLGVLDGLPNDVPNVESLKIMPNSLWQAVVPIAMGMRESMGRPDDYYGISPLAIFRVIKAD